MIAPWYAMTYIPLERVAWRHGYCLALHGSMGRDLDIVAIPWTDDADSPDVLLTAVCKFIVGQAKVDIKPGPPTQKAHGRLAYAIPIGFYGQYLDISILPRVQDKENNILQKP